MIDCPALHHQSDSYPDRFKGRVPLRVRMLRTVGPDFCFLAPNIEPAQRGVEYPAWTNSHGAVCRAVDGKADLGLKPDEFEVTAWLERDGDGWREVDAGSMPIAKLMLNGTAMSPDNKRAGERLLSECEVAEVFSQEGDFEAIRSAERWLRERGMKTGAGCVGCPTAIAMDGDTFVGSSKWRNLYPETIYTLPGCITGERRNGPVVVWLRPGTVTR